MKSILVHLKKLDWILILNIFLIILIGLVTVYSAGKGNLIYFKKQLLFVVLGFFLMLLISYFDWRILKENSYLILLLYIICTFSLLCLLIFGQTTRGVKSWYIIGPFFFFQLIL